MTGPIVRIAPNEVHLNNPDDFDRIHGSGSKFTKDPGFYSVLDGPIKIPVLATMVSPDEHRPRRAKLNPFFSRRSVLELDEVVFRHARKLCNVMQQAFDSSPNNPFEMWLGIRAYALDVVTEYAYGSSWHHLDEQDLGKWFLDVLRTVQGMFPFFQTFPVLVTVFGLVPDWLQTIILPFYKKWVDMLQVGWREKTLILHAIG